MRGLLSSDPYVEWSEAELGKQILLPPLCNSDSLSQYTTIPQPASKHSSNHYSNLSLQLSSTFSLSSHAPQLTRHRLGTPSNALPPFWSPSFWPSDLPRYLSISPTSGKPCFFFSCFFVLFLLAASTKRNVSESKMLLLKRNPLYFFCYFSTHTSTFFLLFVCSVT